MYKNLIIKYIPKITINDIIYFGEKNNVMIDLGEANLILQTIQKDYQTLLSPNYMSIFEKVKPYLSKQCYDKSLDLFLTYQKKYKIF